MKMNSVIGITIAFVFITGVVSEECSNRPNKLFEQDFGLALTPDDFMMSMFSPWSFRDYFRPWRYLSSIAKDTGSTIKADKDSFQINLDVQHFAPEEITVKTADGFVIVEAKHEEKKDDHGLIARHFVRKYSLPEGTEEDTVVSQLSSDGILTVSAKRKEVEKKGEKMIPITKTGPVRKETKQNDKEQSCDSGSEKCETKN